MEMQECSAIMSRISPHRADDVDDLLSRLEGGTTTPGGDIFPVIGPVPAPGPRFKRADAICVGFRATRDLGDGTEHAMRLAAMALERDVEIIVLSETDLSGLERFGFRTERVPRLDAEAHDSWLDQIRGFWNLDLVL